MATGARSGALFELEWLQVNLAGKTIDLQPEGREQTNKARPAVPIADRLLVRLKRLREANPDVRHVLEIDGKRIASNVRKSFAPAAKAAGLDPKKGTPNTLRHR
jgi:integrase